MKKSREGKERRRRKSNHGSHSLSTSREINPPSCFCFYKLMFLPTIQSKKLRIPELFSRAFTEELPGTAILTVPTGESWKVELIKDGNNLWFCEGWEEFVDHFSIAYAYFLLFEYQENLKFEVHIFSPTACEISYRSYARNKFPEKKPIKEDNDLDSGDENLNGHEKRVRRDDDDDDDDVVSDGFTCNLLSSDDDDDDVEIYAEEETNEENRVTQSEDNENRGTRTEKLTEALASVGISMLQKPFFAVFIKKYNIHKGCFVTVPVDFGRKYLYRKKIGKNVKLEGSDGKQWEVEFVAKRKYFRLRGKWVVFARENGLNAGDVCAFELTDPQNLVLKVHVCVESQLRKENKWRQLLKL